MDAMHVLGVPLPERVGPIRSLPNALAADDLGPSHPQLDNTIWDPKVNLQEMIDELWHELTSEMKETLPSLFMEYSFLTLEDIKTTVEAISLADIQLEKRHVQTFFSVFKLFLETTKMSTTDKDLLQFAAEQVVTTTEMAVGASLSVQCDLPSTSTPAAVNVTSEQVARISAMTDAMASQKRSTTTDTYEEDLERQQTAWIPSTWTPLLIDRETDGSIATVKENWRIREDHGFELPEVPDVPSSLKPLSQRIQPEVVTRQMTAKDQAELKEQKHRRREEKRERIRDQERRRAARDQA